MSKSKTPCMYVGTGVGIELSQTKVWTAKKITGKKLNILAEMLEISKSGLAGYTVGHYHCKSSCRS